MAGGSEQNVFYVYALRDPRDGKPFYIGKGMRWRARSHLCPGERTNRRKVARIREIRDAGLEPVVTIEKSGLANFEACNVEIELTIEHGRAGIDPDGILTNLMIGGGCAVSGPNHPAYGLKQNPESVERRRQKLIGKTGNPGSKNGMYGRAHTDSAKAAIAEARTGQKEDPDLLILRAEKIKRTNILKRIETYLVILEWHDRGMPNKYIRTEVGCSWDMVTKAIKERDYIMSIKDEADAI